MGAAVRRIGDQQRRKTNLEMKILGDCLIDRDAERDGDGASYATAKTTHWCYVRLSCLRAAKRSAGPPSLTVVFLLVSDQLEWKGRRDRP